MRTLFIGEDTSYRNNNYVWAYSIDAGELSRILSVPMGAVATGLQAVDNYNGRSYIMSNFQAPGHFGDSDPAWAQVEPLKASGTTTSRPPSATSAPRAEPRCRQ